MITERLPQPGGMGWQPGTGTKAHLYRAADVLVTPPTAPDIRYWNASGWWGDQGMTSQCTIYAWLHVMHDGPITHRGILAPMANPTLLYQKGQDIDGTPRSDVDSGLTSDASAQVMLKEGYIGEYRWARDVDEVVECIRVAGPGTLGSWWPEGMDDPDPLTGFVTYTGRKRGGHQYKVDGVNTRRRFFRMKNSWGRGWGRKGFAYLSFDTMRAILEDGGEFCIARELLNRTVA
jgi:hypothetical protein